MMVVAVDCADSMGALRSNTPDQSAIGAWNNELAKALIGSKKEWEVIDVKIESSMDKIYE
jgi:phage-related minor tail protein